MKDQSKDGLDLYKRKCKKPSETLSEMPAKSVPMPLFLKWEISLEVIPLKSPWSGFKLSGPKRLLKVWKEQARMKRELWNQREEKFNKWWNCLPECVWKKCLPALIDKRSKLLSQSMCIKEIWLLNWSAKTSMISTGRNKLVSIGNKT